ncbi:MAG: gluconate kinase [Psychromonas sp.]
MELPQKDEKSIIKMDINGKFKEIVEGCIKAIE